MEIGGIEEQRMIGREVDPWRIWNDLVHVVQLLLQDGTAPKRRETIGWQLCAGSRTEAKGNPADPKVSHAQPP
jgi:hypothetical protein